MIRDPFGWVIAAVIVYAVYVGLEYVAPSSAMMYAFIVLLVLALIYTPAILNELKKGGVIV